MKRIATLFIGFVAMVASFTTAAAQTFPQVSEQQVAGYLPLATADGAVTICTDAADYAVVGIAAQMLADDIHRVTGQHAALNAICLGKRGQSLPKVDAAPTLYAGTLGKSKLIELLVKEHNIDVSAISGKWESHLLTTLPTGQLLVIGSDRRGTAFGLTALSEAIGVSPWYWWADVTPAAKNALYLEPGTFVQGEPAVQYRGIFINDERFGGWARWSEGHFETETGKVGPKTYQKVFELLLRLRANYLWPAMHPGTQAFNADPENARLADQYAIVMGTSHCEQMLRNNEGEWKAVDQQARSEGRPPVFGDFNYITNHKTMQEYWETRVKTNGQYENTYTLGLRGIHDYPMEGANTTAERVRLMQQAINDQCDMLSRNIKRPIEEIPQVLCTYEEVPDANHNGLQVPDDVTMLWSDDKHGYCRNLCNLDEQKRPGGAGVFYHLAYHGDPASWLWLCPLPPTFVSTELTKAYTYRARKIWVFNVGDIKPAEKEISFVMDLARNIDRWTPSEAHNYIKYWATKTFSADVALEIADMQRGYYQLQAAGKDAHVWFVNYSEEQIEQRIAQWRALAAQALDLEKRIPARLKDAYFELVSYPIRGAAMINEYQLLARRSMVRANAGDAEGALADGRRFEEMFGELNAWTDRYNNEIQPEDGRGKWTGYFNWQPYHWFRSEKIEQPYATSEVLAQAQEMPEPRFLDVKAPLSAEGLVVESDRDAEVPLWIEALTPIRNFSKVPEDNVFCRVNLSPLTSFEASATPINNVWHAPYVGPMWSRVGTLRLQKGENRLCLTDVKPDARINQMYLGLYPPFVREPRLRIPAADYQRASALAEARITRISDLGYAGGVLVQPFDTPSYELSSEAAPYVEYDLDLLEDDSFIEVLAPHASCLRRSRCPIHRASGRLSSRGLLHPRGRLHFRMALERAPRLCHPLCQS